MKGMQSYKDGNYRQGLQEVTSAIEIASEEDLEKFPDVLADRCFMNSFLRNDENVLSDAEKALKNPNLSRQGRIVCYMCQYSSYLNKDLRELAYEALEKFEECSDCAKYEFTEDHIVIKNIPNNSFRRNFTTCLLIHSGMAKGKSDVHFFDSKCIVERNKNPPCQCEDIESFKCDNCGETVYLGVTAHTIESCKSQYCDRAHELSTNLCNFFPEVTCRIFCMQLLNELRRACHWCCNSGDFYSKCIKPFENFMKEIPCDPVFDN
jgi:hypothetical protein